MQYIIPTQRTITQQQRRQRQLQQLQVIILVQDLIIQLILDIPGAGLTLIIRIIRSM